MPVKPAAIIAIVGGGVVLYSGFKGLSVSSAVRDLLMGENPANAKSANPITPLTSTAGTASIGNIGSISGPTLHGNVTPRQVYVAFRKAGISQHDAIILTAITGVESGYSTTALNTNANTGDYSVGLTQINYFDGLYAERAPHIGSPQQLLDGGLARQAAATAWLWRQDGLQPWMPDITSGKINQFMQQAMAAAAGGP